MPINGVYCCQLLRISKYQVVFQVWGSANTKWYFRFENFNSAPSTKRQNELVSMLCLWLEWKVKKMSVSKITAAHLTCTYFYIYLWYLLRNNKTTLVQYISLWFHCLFTFIKSFTKYTAIHVHVCTNSQPVIKVNVPSKLSPVNHLVQHDR